ncbi:hypothetical protein [Streptomyces sp. NPDC002588]|uniref:hypothetical protein n=1 Tax=Streptomyces sp. NPDC002588 TaxID=3154419 RepID=UPI00332D1B1D
MTLFERVTARTAGRHAVHLEWFRTRLRLFSDLPDATDYLVAQHHVVGPPVPAGDPPPPRAPAPALHLTADARLLDVVRGTASGQRITGRESFTGWWYDCWRAGDGVFVLSSGRGHESEHALLTTDFRSWALVGAHPGPLPGTAARTIRELVREDLLAEGALMMHASAAVLPDGRGLVMVGGSGAGKTSAAVRVARARGRCVATDRLLLLPDGADWIAVGLPMSTRLGVGALRALGVTDDLLRRPLIRHRAGAPSPASSAGARSADPRAKLSLSNEEVFDVIGGGFVSATRVDRVVVLRACATAMPRLSTLTPAEAVPALREEALLPDPAYRSRWLAHDPRPEPATWTLGHLSALAADVPVAELRWDPHLHCDEQTHNRLAPRGRRTTARTEPGTPCAAPAGEGR